MSAYEPVDHVELVHRIRAAVGDQTAIRIDAHGTWNFQEARRILHAVEDCNLEYAEQPFNALLPDRFYARDGSASPAPPARPPESGGYQAEYYFRRMTELRREL